MDKYERIGLLIEQRRYELAEQALRERLSQEPEDGIAYSMLALCLTKIGRPDAALAAAQKGVALEPQMPSAHYRLAYVHYQRDELRSMLRAARQTLALDAADAHAHALVAMYWAHQNDAKKMLHHAEVGLSHDVLNEQCQLFRAEALISLWRLDDAVEAVRSLLLRNPNSSFAMSGRGWIH